MLSKACLELIYYFDSNLNGYCLEFELVVFIIVKQRLLLIQPLIKERKWINEIVNSQYLITNFAQFNLL